jgi:membrane glycosyltransferase
MDFAVGKVRTSSYGLSFIEAAGSMVKIVRRIVFGFLIVLISSAGIAWCFRILSADGFSSTEVALAILFVPTFFLVALSFVQGVIGFLVFLFAKDPISYVSPVARVLTNFSGPPASTALLFPIYFEDPQAVSRNIRWIYRSLAQSNTHASYSFFVLSDTTSEEQGREEEKVFNSLASELNEPFSIFYRRRIQNVGRKAGNIRDFCQHWGEQFDFMIVLDADSLMSGQLISRMVGIMQRNPQVGILQSVPRVISSKTWFAKIIQFGHRLAGEILAAGAAFWQLGDGNYYGHNAIIRIKPFFEHCKMPILKGKGPLSGEILSHDFVEGAYMRRAGYELWMLPTGEGSYEGIPSNLIDYAKRDRRWCQGNLQHARVLLERGLHPISRFHLALGILSYLSSPIWFALLVLSLAKLSYEAVVGPVYFPAEYSLFPTWPEPIAREAASLFFTTFAMLLLPKFLGLVLILSDSRLARMFGGRLAMVMSFLLEVVFSVLLAPIMMVFNSKFVISILSGKSSGWPSQSRDARGVSFWEALRSLGAQVVVGIVIMVVVFTYVPEFFVWTAPLCSGLLLSVFLVCYSSRNAGEVTDGFRSRLFATSEDILELAE